MEAQTLPSLADAPGTRREYETIYILRPNASNTEVAEVNNKVRGVIEKMGGTVLKVDNWGKRRLAYEITKERRGIYLYWQYLAVPGLVDEIERNMRLLDDVIRYMTVKLATDVDPEARPTDVDDEAYERAANTAADEEDMFLRRSPTGEGEEGEEGSDKAAEGADAESASASAEGEAATTATTEAADASDASPASAESPAAESTTSTEKAEEE